MGRVDYVLRVFPEGALLVALAPRKKGPEKGAAATAGTNGDASLGKEVTNGKEANGDAKKGDGDAVPDGPEVAEAAEADEEEDVAEELKEGSSSREQRERRGKLSLRRLGQLWQLWPPCRRR